MISHFKVHGQGSWWWWSRGQRARLLFLRYEFESCGNLQFYCKTLLKKNENEGKSGLFGPFKKWMKSGLINWLYASHSMASIIKSKVTQLCVAWRFRNPYLPSNKHIIKPQFWKYQIFNVTIAISIILIRCFVRCWQLPNQVEVDLALLKSLQCFR